MPRDIEAELRRSLQARATDITPDPAMFSRVQSRIRRGRTLRMALAGVATALAITGVAVAAPRLMDQRIEFEPGPVATQPAPEPAATDRTATSGGSVPMVFTDGKAVYSAAAGEESAAELMRSDYAPTCPADANCAAVLGVAERPGASGDVISVEGCNGIRVSGRNAMFAADRCPVSAAFSPDGSHLVYLSLSSPMGEWSLHSVDWTADGPGENDASFGLPEQWPADQPVDIQDWVWTEQTATTAKGYLVLRTQREGAWMLLQMPIERQGDGALAVTLDMGLLTSMIDAGTPVVFAAGGGDYSNGEDITYVMELDMARNGIEGGRIVRQVGAEGGGVLDLPPELFDNTDPPFDVADLWMSAAGDTLLYGNSGQQQAWAADWSRITVTPQVLAIPRPGGSDDAPTPIVHADLLVPASTATAGEQETEPVPVHSQVEVYFGMTGADACVADQPVTREVEGAGVARAAVTELLKGPNSRESNEGLVSPFSANTAGALNDIVIVDGEARVDLSRFDAALVADSCMKSAIVDALDKTLRQFPSITSTRYSFDGDADAWEQWLGSGSETPSMPEAVAETAENILAAAQARDYDRLRDWIPPEGLSCSLSDQPENCIRIWRDQEDAGGDPLGTLAEVLQSEPRQDADAGMWYWPRQWGNGRYDGPRVGIDDDGVWRFYLQSGG